MHTGKTIAAGLASRRTKANQPRDEFTFYPFLAVDSVAQFGQIVRPRQGFLSQCLLLGMLKTANVEECGRWPGQRKHTKYTILYKGIIISATSIWLTA